MTDDLPEIGVPTTPEDFPAEGPNSLAGLGQRLLARLMDIGLAVVFMMVLLGSTGELPEPGATEWTPPAWVSLTIVLVVWGYDVVMVAARGQTLGKMALGIKVVNVGDGSIPDFGPALVRGGILLVPGMIPGIGTFVGLAVSLSPTWQKIRRGWHDLAAATVVVKAR